MYVDAEKLGLFLQKRQEWVTTAESCTGGMIAAAITDIAGSSAYFGTGFVTYSNEAKQHLLGVNSVSLQVYGAVSELVVQEMVQGACRRATAQWGVAVSGIAGPGGGSAEKPVGTVWFGFVAPERGLWTRCCCFQGDRADVRHQTVETALAELWLTAKQL